MSIPLLHQTDLFHPHEDPDDHWDLACVYALAHAGLVDLRGVLIDRPPAGHPGAPDVMGVAQLNHVTGLAVPVVVGSSRPVERRGQTPDAFPKGQCHAVQFLLRVLEEAREPVVITMGGSCRDVALAGAAAPGLFRDKCRGVYLNAGSGTNRPDLLGELEYNVRLNAAAFAGIFDLPCPVYWMPCFELTPPRWRVEEFGSFYQFRQEEILPHLSARMQSYFAYMFERSPSPDWLGALQRAPDERVMKEFGVRLRNMWCTAGFFHAAGQSVTIDGEIVPLAGARSRSVFEFQPVDASCDDDGVVHWRGAKGASPSRFIFRVTDPERYATAMTRAMRTLLEGLP